MDVLSAYWKNQSYILIFHEFRGFLYFCQNLEVSLGQPNLTFYDLKKEDKKEWGRKERKKEKRK